MRETLLLLWVLVVMACSFLLSHFWSCTIYVIQKAVALGILPLLLFLKPLAGIAGIHLFSWMIPLHRVTYLFIEI